MKGNRNKLVIVILLIVVVATVILVKNRTKREKTTEKIVVEEKVSLPKISNLDVLKKPEEAKIEKDVAIEASKPLNPLDKALRSGKPTVLDLGAGYCVPCQMMKPIFEELEREYKGKANIILLEISEYQNLANRYRVRVIPTQIFFDKEGNTYWRHEGFLAKGEIIKKLRELGVN